MGDIIRLIEGLLAGDPTAIAVLAFTVIGTTAILGLTAMIRRARK